MSTIPNRSITDENAKVELKERLQRLEANSFTYDSETELRRYLFDIFMIMDYYGGRVGIEEMEGLLDKLVFANQSKEILLADLREHLLNGEFEGVKLPEGTQLRCLEWVNKKRESLLLDLKEKKTINEIALQFVWEGKSITTQNKDILAQDLTSNNNIQLANGTKLYNQYLWYSRHSNRVGDQGGDKKNRNHFKLMMKARKNLSDLKYQETAENDIITFKKNAENISGTIF